VIFILQDNGIMFAACCAITWVLVYADAALDNLKNWLDMRANPVGQPEKGSDCAGFLHGQDHRCFP
jgi:hypothetical protein